MPPDITLPYVHQEFPMLKSYCICQQWVLFVMFIHLGGMEYASRGVYIALQAEGINCELKPFSSPRWEQVGGLNRRYWYCSSDTRIIFT